MTRKCFNNHFCDDLDHPHHHEAYGDSAYVSFKEPQRNTDFEQLGRWILQAQDGEINESDLQQLHHCLLTNPEALQYYVDFSWLCAALHTLYSRKQAVLTSL